MVTGLVGQVAAESFQRLAAVAPVVPVQWHVQMPARNHVYQFSRRELPTRLNFGVRPKPRPAWARRRNPSTLAQR